MRISQIMSRPVVTASVDSTAGLTARLMWEYDCGIIPLTDREGRLSGVVTDRDLCMAAYTQGRPLGAIPVRTAMSSRVVACRAEDTVEKVEQLMRDNRVRRVPVIDGQGNPIGIVSVSDVARMAPQGKKGAAADRGIVRTVAAISEPRGAAQPNDIAKTPAA
jgi:CBS domain-containing protein